VTATGLAGRLVAPGATIERLATGFRFSEGPVWDHRNDRLVFSDIPASKVFSWSQAAGIEILREPSSRANGNAIDAHGRLVTCEHDTGRVVRESGAGHLDVLADSWNGAPLNSPNDIVIALDGAIYFTDPDYGRTIKPFGGVRPVPQAFNGVYLITPDGRLTCMIADMLQPNGLCFSPDGSKLYVNDTQRSHIRCFDVMPDGGLTGGAVLADIPSSATAAPDGMKADTGGRLYCTGGGGIHVVDQAGAHLGVIEVAENVGNLAFGGDDGRTLFICASRSLYRLRMAVSGAGLV
jgi:gluconolactonase